MLSVFIVLILLVVTRLLGEAFGRKNSAVKVLFCWGNRWLCGSMLASCRSCSWERCWWCTLYGDFDSIIWRGYAYWPYQMAAVLKTLDHHNSIDCWSQNVAQW